jgi:uncharacterized membrane protein
MNKERINAFTDAVIAIIMTILVLELEQPSKPTWEAVWELRDSFIPYLISFFALAILWNNHHHTMQVVKKVNGKVLWANNVLLFLTSLFPWVTRFVDRHLSATAPEVLYGLVCWGMFLSYFILFREASKADPENKELAFVLSRSKRIWFDLIALPCAIILSYFMNPIIVLIVSFIALVTWLIPEKRAEILTK